MIIIKDQYKLKKNRKYLIGKGGFGRVYIGTDLKLNKKIAVKVEKNSEKKYNRKEHQIYKMIENKEYTAKALDYYEDEFYSYLVMPFYHISCDKIFKKSEKYFTVKDICMLCIQIIQQLHVLHNLGIVHRDIKPDNFVWDKESNRIKLIDFGLCKSYIIDNEHMKFKKSFSRSGTLRYMSVNCQNGYALSRRDDLISLAYSLIYLYKKTVPWKKVSEKNKKKLYARVKNIKTQFNDKIDELKLPEPLQFLTSYSLGLKFNQKPDYSFVIKVFYDFIKRSTKYNGQWSWIDDEI
jgi:serine/threonine protein kinase